MADAEDGSVLAPISGKKTLYLLRLPADMALADLDGTELELDNGHRDYKLPGGKRAKITKEVGAYCDQSFRPLAYSSAAQAVTVGDAFAATINVHPTVKLPAMPVELPDEVVDSYAVKSQLDFIQVRSVPIGSSSTVEEVLERTRAQAPVKRTTAAAAPATVAPATAVRQGEEKKEAKAKKEGKEKKEKKERRDKK